MWDLNIFPDGFTVKNLLQDRSCEFNPWVEKIPWRRKWPTPVFFLENPMDRGAWWATVHGIAKELDMTERLSNNHLFAILKSKKQKI